MTKRLPGMRMIVVAIIQVIPQVAYALLICGVFMFSFSIFSVSFFKGQFRSCQGHVYQNIIVNSTDYNNLLTYPVSWSAMTNEQQSWFGPMSSVTSFNATTCNMNGWPNSACCPQISQVDSNSPLTSRMICECWGGRWSPVVPQKFDNVFVATISLFEISTFSNWGTIVVLVFTDNFHSRSIR